MDVGTLIMSGLMREHVLDAVRVVISHYDQNERGLPPAADYEGRSVSKQVLRIVLSYIDYVNRNVWRKDS